MFLFASKSFLTNRFSIKLKIVLIQLIVNSSLGEAGIDVIRLAEPVLKNDGVIAHQIHAMAPILKKDSVIHEDVSHNGLPGQQLVNVPRKNFEI